VRQTCLYVATKLGDLLDELVVVGGLVPSLLIPEESVPRGEDIHVETRCQGQYAHRIEHGLSRIYMSKQLSTVTI
jgi:hypothetical protein